MPEQIRRRKRRTEGMAGVIMRVIKGVDPMSTLIGYARAWGHWNFFLTEIFILFSSTILIWLCQQGLHSSLASWILPFASYAKAVSILFFTYKHQRPCYSELSLTLGYFMGNLMWNLRLWIRNNWQTAEVGSCIMNVMFQDQSKTFYFWSRCTSRFIPLTFMPCGFSVIPFLLIFIHFIIFPGKGNKYLILNLFPRS